MSNFARKKRTVKQLCSFFRMEKGIVEVFSHLIIYIILNNSQKKRKWLNYQKMRSVN